MLSIFFRDNGRNVDWDRYGWRRMSSVGRASERMGGREIKDGRYRKRRGPSNSLRVTTNGLSQEPRSKASGSRVSCLVARRLNVYSWRGEWKRTTRTGLEV